MHGLPLNQKSLLAIGLAMVAGFLVLGFQNCSETLGEPPGGASETSQDSSLPTPTPVPTPDVSPPLPVPAMSAGKIEMLVGTSQTVSVELRNLKKPYLINWNLPAGAKFTSLSGALQVSPEQTKAGFSITSNAAPGSGPASYQLTLRDAGDELSAVVITVNVSDPTPPARIATGVLDSCAAIGGVFKCWGYSNFNEGGYVTLHNTPTAILGLPAGVFQKAASGYYTSCVILSGALYCWGSNAYGELGNGSNVSTFAPSSTAVVGMETGVTDVSIGNNHVCAIKTGAVYCWGLNNYGQLGLGVGSAVDVTNRSVASLVPGLPATATAVSAGALHTCAVVGGATKCWGYNGYNQLGDGTATTRYSPVEVPGAATGATAVAVGAYHSCAVVAVSLKCWGYNAHGELGDGTAVQKAAATTISGVTKVTSVAAGIYHTCALTQSGVYCWGYNGYGQVGDGTAGTVRYSPVAATGLSTGVSALASQALSNHTCAVQNNVAKCWGRGDYGQIGNGISQNVFVPTAVKF